MGKIIPDEVIRNNDIYDKMFKHIFDKVSLQLNMHCLIHRCPECFRPYNFKPNNQCFCYCQTCRTF